MEPTGKPRRVRSRSDPRAIIGVRTCNEREIAVCQRLESEGWTVVARGWPTFLAYRAGQVRLIAVKRIRQTDGRPKRLTPAQVRLAAVLKAGLGVVVEVLSD